MSETRGERLQVMLTPEEVTALDDWRFARRMPSRAAAVRELLRLGLAAEGAFDADMRMKSKDFGVIDDPSSMLDDDDLAFQRDGAGGDEAIG